MKARVENIQDNSRYKVIRYENNFYLYDNDRNIFAVLFPILKLILPSKLHKIDRSVYEQLDTLAQKPENPLKGKTAFLGGIGVTIASILRGFEEFFLLGTSIIMNALILLFVCLLCVVFRISKSTKSKLKLDKNYTYSCFLVPRYKYLLKYLSGCVFLIFSICFAILTFILSGHIIIILGFIMFLLIMLFLIIMFLNKVK